jgi:hypothetical protein
MDPHQLLLRVFHLFLAKLLKNSIGGNREFFFLR